MKRRIIILFIIVLLIVVPGCAQKAWEGATELNTVNSYNAFVLKYPDSEFAVQARGKAETLFWLNRSKTDTIASYEQYLAEYSGGKYIANAKVRMEELFWTLQQAASVKVEKADSLSIYSGGRGAIRGQVRFSYGGDTQPRSGGPNRVYIWRDFSSNEISYAKKFDLRIGIAYLVSSDELIYKFIKKIDLNKSDEELCNEFGIEFH